MTVALSVDDDRTLLSRWAVGRDQAAFSALVSRYTGLVYTSARRRVGSRPLAEDVAQAVFVLLARRAAALTRGQPGQPLSAWLLRATRYAAANAVRVESRRRRHEGAFARDAGAGLCSRDPSEVLVWGEVAPLIDDAVLSLSSDDRRVVLLRYFEGRSVADLAGSLNVSPDAARQRICRATERLRTKLRRRGVSVASTTLSTLLVAQAVRAAPAALVATCSTAPPAAALSLTIAKGALIMMHTTHVKTVTVAVLAALGLSLAGTKIAVGTDATPAAVSTPAAGPRAAAPTPVQPEQFRVTNMPPVVVRTVPATGDTKVDPGLKEIRVTFNKAMLPGNFSFAQMSDDSFPKTTGKPQYLPEEQTFVLPVELEPSHAYVLRLNFPPFDSFMDAQQRKAAPYLLIFETAPAAN